ncbi:SIS domain-containing protein [Thermogemmatispora sp.]|uniref:D-sedoheptulose-7-phosphate isomerase n=1 Tax=Thermogemmatispora sp. TaxID=1968838 RepID=UPI0035E429B4
MSAETPEGLAAVLERRFALSTSLPATFFESEAPRIAEACWAMARRFHQGGRLLAFGNGAWASDAQHVSVEFVHPVIVGKRALPALALTNDSATLTGLMAGGRPEMPFSEQLRILARPQDIALGFSPDGRCPNVVAALAQARRMGLLTLAMLGGDGGLLGGEAVDYCFVVPADDPLIVQEVHETLYHILWELVHVFFENEGLLS